MAIRCAVVMDAIEAIYPVKDSSFALMLEAQRRAYELYYVKPGSLSIAQGKAMAQLARIQLFDRAEQWFALSEYETCLLSELDVIFMRTDPPVDSHYLHDTQILSLAQDEGVLLVNNPQGLRDLNEKLAAMLFPDCCPNTLVSRDKAALKAFVQTHGEAVLKPLDGMGGRSIFRASSRDANLNVILETLLDGGKSLVMAQEYLPAITEGDKRILLIDGEAVPYCLARIPQGDEFRGNLAAGGRGEGRPLSDSDRKIAQRVGPELKKRGMLLVGLDVIGDRLTEVNVTSPTCIRELDKQFGLNIAGMLFDAVEAKLEQRRP